MLKCKKFVSITLAIVMTLSLSCFSVFAEESDGLYIGKIVEYNISTLVEENGQPQPHVLTPSERIAYMDEHNQTPGTEFAIGENNYRVLDDYRLQYIGKVSTDNNLTENILTRGVNIPTSRGSLPYSGTYDISTFIYSGRYFTVGSSGYNPSIAVAISANDRQNIGVSYMDARVDESMGNHNRVLNPGDSWVFYDWVYGGENFYIKFFNADYDGTWISGGFNIYVDQ